MIAVVPKRYLLEALRNPLDQWYVDMSCPSFRRDCQASRVEKCKASLTVLAMVKPVSKIIGMLELDDNQDSISGPRRGIIDDTQ